MEAANPHAVLAEFPGEGANVVDGTRVSQALRERIRAIVPPSEMRNYGRISPLRSILDMLHITGALALCVFLTLWVTSFDLLSLTLGAALVFVIGTRFNAVNVQIHEASHFLLFRNKAWNDGFVNVFLAFPALQDVSSYRSSHKLHHRYLHGEEDPDRPIYADFGTLGRVAKYALLDVAMMSFARMLLNRGGMRHKVNFAPGITAAKLAYQCAILSVFVALHGPLHGVMYYGIFWVYPLLAIYPMLVRLRTVVQHFDRRPGLAFVSRTTLARPLQHYFLGCAMDYHFEHHLYPALPYYGLAKLNRCLRNAGFFDPQGAPVDYLTRDFLVYYFRLNRT